MVCKLGGCGAEPLWYSELAAKHQRLRARYNWLLVLLGVWMISSTVGTISQISRMDALTARVEALECPAPVTNPPEPPPAVPEVK